MTILQKTMGKDFYHFFPQCADDMVDGDEANTRNAEEKEETFDDEVLPEDGNVY